MQILNNAPEGSEMYDSALAQLEDAPEIPFYLEHIWTWFWQIHRRKNLWYVGAEPPNLARYTILDNLITNKY